MRPYFFPIYIILYIYNIIYIYIILYIYILYNIHTFICSIGTNSPISFTSLLWRQDRQFQVPLKSLPLGSWWPHRWQAKACHWGMEGQNMKHTMGRTWRFPESWGYPQIIQVMDNHSSIDTHGFGMFWGSPILRNPPHGYVMVDLLASPEKLIAVLICSCTLHSWSPKEVWSLQSLQAYALACLTKPSLEYKNCMWQLHTWCFHLDSIYIYHKIN